MNLICKPHDKTKANLMKQIIQLNEPIDDISTYFTYFTRFRKDVSMQLKPGHQQWK